MKVFEFSSPFKTKHVWYFVYDDNNIFEYRNARLGIERYCDGIEKFKEYMFSILWDGVWTVTNISDDLDIHFQHIAEDITNKIEGWRAKQ